MHGGTFQLSPPQKDKLKGNNERCKSGASWAGPSPSGVDVFGMQAWTGRVKGEGLGSPGPRP